jgi:hypothetical protein
VPKVRQAIENRRGTIRCVVDDLVDLQDFVDASHRQC